MPCTQYEIEEQEFRFRRLGLDDSDAKWRALRNLAYTRALLGTVHVVTIMTKLVDKYYDGLTPISPPV